MLLTVKKLDSPQHKPAVLWLFSTNQYCQPRRVFTPCQRWLAYQCCEQWHLLRRLLCSITLYHCLSCFCSQCNIDSSHSLAMAAKIILVMIFDSDFWWYGTIDYYVIVNWFGIHHLLVYSQWFLSHQLSKISIWQNRRFECVRYWVWLLPAIGSCALFKKGKTTWS